MPSFVSSFVDVDDVDDNGNDNGDDKGNILDWVSINIDNSVISSKRSEKFG